MAKEDDRHNIFLNLENRFGIPESLFDDYLLFSTKRSWVLIKNATQIAWASHLKISKVGLKSFQRVGNFVKPTTRFIQTFGRFATEAKFQVNMSQLRTLLESGEIPVDLKLDNGYVVLSVGANRVLGLGLLINGKIRSQLPKKEIRSAMLNMESNETIVIQNQNQED